MEATWSPVSKCSVLANLKKEVGNAQNYRVSRATKQLLVTQASWDPFFICNIHIPFKVPILNKSTYSICLPDRPVYITRRRMQLHFSKSSFCLIHAIFTAYSDKRTVLLLLCLASNYLSISPYTTANSTCSTNAYWITNKSISAMFTNFHCKHILNNQEIISGHFGAPVS